MFVSRYAVPAIAVLAEQLSPVSEEVSFASRANEEEKDIK